MKLLDELENQLQEAEKQKSEAILATKDCQAKLESEQPTSHKLQDESQ